MRTDRKQLKRDMLDAIHSGKTSIVWIAVAFLVLTLLLQGLSMSVSGELSALQAMAQQLAETGMAAIPTVETSSTANLLVLAIDVMLAMLSVGFSVACLSTARRQGASVGNLFDGFACFFRALGVQILQYLILSAYSMVYVLPATLLMTEIGPLALLLLSPMLIFVFLAFYDYRQSIFLLLDHPQLRSLDCLRASRRLMRGHRRELIRLDLSFIGWVLLCLIPLAVIWVLPYMQVCYAGYYDRLMQPYRSKMDAEATPPETPDEQ